MARDPAFFLAYYQLALTHDKAYMVGVDDTPGPAGISKKAVEAARRLRPDSGEAHLAYTYHLYCAYLEYDHARAELVAGAAIITE